MPETELTEQKIPLRFEKDEMSSVELQKQISPLVEGRDYLELLNASKPLTIDNIPPGDLEAWTEFFRSRLDAARTLKRAVEDRDVPPTTITECMSKVAPFTLFTSDIHERQIEVFEKTEGAFNSRINGTEPSPDEQLLGEALFILTLVYYKMIKKIKDESI